MNAWNDLPPDMFAIAALAIGLLAAAFGTVLIWNALKNRPSTGSRGSRNHRRQRKIPRDWPLEVRPLIAGAERHVWHWLLETFPECSVLPKLPVTRFTTPLSQREALNWFDLINNVYCTFTLCDSKGHVLGCVDVVRPNNFSRDNQQLKQSLLSHCGMAYWVVTPDALPNPAIIRAEFLDDEDTAAKPPQRALAPTPRAQTKDKKAAGAAPAPHRAPSRSQPAAPLTAAATAPAPLVTDFQETQSQLREALIERRRNRRHQYPYQYAANDDKNPPAPPVPVSKKPLPAAASVSVAGLVENNSFFMSLDEEKDRHAMLAVLSAARRATG